MSSTPNNNGVAPIKKVLTAADVISKSSSSAGDPASPGNEEAPKLFSLEIYNDFQSALLLLEKRAKGNTDENSLRLEEVTQFEEETDRIVKEMKDYIADPKGCGETIRLGYEASAAGVDGVVVEAVAKQEEAVPSPVIAAASTPPPAAQTNRSASPTHSLSTDTNTPLPNVPPKDDEDEEFTEGYGPQDGLAVGGMARGTTNTYALEGMEEMSAEEYRDKLQESISARQAERRKQSLLGRGKIGNMNSSGYLDALSGGGGLGAPGVVKAAVVGGSNKKEQAPQVQWSSKTSAPSWQPPTAQTAVTPAIPAPALTSFSTNNNEPLPSAEVSPLPNVPQDEDYGLALGGMARGTTNTYALEGMEEMSAEEYRDKLQESISARQAERRKQSLLGRGKIGNMNSSGYLDALSGGGGLGAPGVVRAAVVGGENGKKEGEEQQGEKKKSIDVSASVGVSGAKPQFGLWKKPTVVKQEEVIVEVSNNNLSMSVTDVPMQSQQVQQEPTKKRQEEVQKIQAAREANEAKVIAQEERAEWLKKENALVRERFEKRQRQSDEEDLSMSVTDIPMQQEPEIDTTEKSQEEVQKIDLAKRAVMVEEERAKWLKKENALVKERFEKSQRLDEELESKKQVESKQTIPVEEKLEEKKTQGSHGVPQRKVDTPEQAEGKKKSPMLTLRKTKLDKEVHSQKSEWSIEATPEKVGGNGASNSDADQQSSDKAAVLSNTLSSADEPSAREGRIPAVSSPLLDQVTTKSSGKQLRSNVEDFRGNQQNRQRPIPSSSSQPKRFFQMHSTTSFSTSSVDRSVIEEASIKVSAVRVGQRRESTQSFVHGNEAENSQRPTFTSSTKEGDPRYFQVHGTAGDLRRKNESFATSSVVAGANKKSLADIEERIRPSPSATELPQYVKATDHRDVGDTKDPRNLSAVTATASKVKSLVDSEVRIRPIPSSSSNTKVATDHRDVGDVRNTKSAESTAAKSLVEMEEQIRPAAASSNLPGYAQVKDRRSVGDVKDPKSRLQQEQQPLMEERIQQRPTAKSNQAKVVTTDHRGPGDDHTLTKKRGAAAQHHPQQSVSLSEAEQRVRPTPSSADQSRNVQVSDHRGPGDNHALTRRLEESSSPVTPQQSVSLSEAEQRIRPTPYSNQSRNAQQAQVSDHRGVGDTRTLTKKVQSSVSSLVVTSLSEDEQRQRPIPSSGTGQSQETFQVSDHRGPGDTRALTKKQSSSSSVSSSLSEGEQRQRPIPSSTSQNHTHSDKKTPPSADATSQLSGEDEPTSSSDWWNEKSQRPRHIHSSADSSKSKVLIRAADNTQKQAVKSSSATIDDEEEPSLLKSLLKDEKSQSNVSKKKNGGVAMRHPPIAAANQPSSLQSLLKGDRPIAGSITENTNTHPLLHDSSRHSPTKTSSKLSSLLDDESHTSRTKRGKRSVEDTAHTMGWWNEKSKRPRGYVGHFQPMNASYVKKLEAPRDYGAVVSTQEKIVFDDDDEDYGSDDSSSQEEGIDEDADGSLEGDENED